MICSKKKPCLDHSLKNINQALAQGICSGCGGCHVFAERPYSENIYGEILPPVDNESLQTHMSSACPFVDETPSENFINGEIYADLPMFHDDVGYYSQLIAGHVHAGSYRARGASGGLVKWFLVKALDMGIVDCVVQVKQTTNPASLFEYYIAETADQVRLGAKSAYYPTNFASVIRKISEDSSSRRYAFVGLPCFCHSLRLLQRQSEVLKEKIPLVVSIFCGHLKSKNYLALMSLQAGRPCLSGEIDFADFRHKSPTDLNASRYSFLAKMSTGETYSSQRTSLPAGDWKTPHLKLKACDFCEDVFGLTADVVFGDAWIPPFFQDAKGSNIVVVRSLLAQEIFRDADSEITVSEVSMVELIKSQGGSYTHRIKDICFRLQEEENKYGWAPKKKSMPYFSKSTKIKRFKKRQMIQKLRVQIRELSRQAMISVVNEGDLQGYNERIEELNLELNRLYQ